MIKLLVEHNQIILEE